METKQMCVSCEGLPATINAGKGWLICQLCYDENERAREAELDGKEDE